MVTGKNLALMKKFYLGVQLRFFDCIFWPKGYLKKTRLEDKGFFSGIFTGRIGQDRKKKILGEFFRELLIIFFREIP